MHPFFIYIIKANALLVLFWLVYKLFLKNETFYKVLRVYFLLGIVCALAAPLVTFTKTVIIAKSVVDELPYLDEEFLNEMPAAAEQPTFWESIDWQNWSLYLLAAVSGVLVLQVVYKVFQLIRNIQKMPAHQNSNIRLADTEHTVYSFYRWIVVPKNIFSRSDFQMILDHENVHLNQKHTFDLLIIELVAAVFWFNPLIKMLRKDININLEYIVDEEMIGQHERVAYQKSLIGIQSTQQLALTSAFNTSDLKKRILHINAKKSNKMKRLKLLLTAPALAAFFAMFQVETIAQVQTEEVQELKETSYIVKADFQKQDLDNVSKALKEDFDIDFIIEKVVYKNGKIADLDYTLRNKDLKISSSQNNEKAIQDFIIIVDLSKDKPFRVENYPEKAKYAVTVDNDKDPDFIITDKEWQSNGWIDKITKNQTTVFIVDGEKSTEAAVRNLNPSEIFSISVHKDKATKNKYTANANNLVIIRTKSQVKNQVTDNHKVTIGQYTASEATDEDLANAKIITVGSYNNAADYKTVSVGSYKDTTDYKIVRGGSYKDAAKYKAVWAEYAEEDAKEVTFTGISTLSNDQLYIIDGAESTLDDLIKIKPVDIEKVDVIKDKEKLKKYGTKAKNGIIVVTTKNNKEVAVQQHVEELKARERAVQQRKEVLNQRKELLSQRKKELEKAKASNVKTLAHFKTSYDLSSPNVTKQATNVEIRYNLKKEIEKTKKERTAALKKARTKLEKAKQQRALAIEKRKVAIEKRAQERARLLQERSVQ